MVAAKPITATRRKQLEMIGTRHGRLVVVTVFRSNGKTFAECLCDCGDFSAHRLDGMKHGEVRSCGCLHADLTRVTFRKHGEGGKTPEYRAWSDMLGRCANPNNNYFHRYGGRGIRVCERWLTSYPNFLEDMGRRPGAGYSLDRIDNDGHYEPGNCKWSTAVEQGNNTMQVHRLTFLEKTQSIAEWARECGMREITLRSRIRAGWDVSTALTKTVRPRARRRINGN